METWQVLEKAAALIEERGWCQGRFESRTGEVCALGAIATTLDAPRINGDFDWMEVNKLPAVEMLARRIGTSDKRGPAERVYDWNDSHATDAFEVVETLRRVAQDEWARTNGGAA